MNREKVSKAKFLSAYRPRNMIMDLTLFEHKFKVKLPKLKEQIEQASKEYFK